MSTYSEWVFVALVIQHAKRMRLVAWSSVASPAVQCSSTLSHNRHDFRGKKIIEHKLYVLFLSTTSV